MFSFNQGSLVTAYLLRLYTQVKPPEQYLEFAIFIENNTVSDLVSNFDFKNVIIMLE